jgi:hypothetical protein
MRSVNGLFETTANLADVVNGLPTNGLNAKINGALVANAWSPALPYCNSNRVPSPVPPMKWRSVRSAMGTKVLVAAHKSISKNRPW